MALFDRKIGPSFRGLDMTRLFKKRDFDVGALNSLRDEGHHRASDPNSQHKIYPFIPLFADLPGKDSRHQADGC
jgi:hypothetical protein